MKELIKIEETVISNEKVNAVSARELHKVLEVKSRYNDWIKARLEKYDFQEGIDFCCVNRIFRPKTKAGRAGSSSYTDHMLTLDVARTLMSLEILRDKRSSPDRIYLIQNTSTKSIKIGVSKDVDGRLNSLQTGHEHQLKLIYTKPIENALGLESKLHRKFSSKRIRGEWFKVSPEKVIKEIEKLQLTSIGGV